MSGQYPQWNSRQHGFPSQISGQQPVTSPNYVNGPGNPAIQRPPHTGGGPPTMGPPLSGMTSSPNPNAYSTAPTTGTPSIVNGYKGDMGQQPSPRSSASSNTMVDAQPLANGPPGPGMSVVGPRGQILGKSVSSPAGTGPIENTTLTNFSQAQMPGGAFRGPAPPGPSVGVRYPGPPMAGPAMGVPPSSSPNAPLIRGPPPMMHHPPGSVPPSRPPGPPQVGMRPPHAPPVTTIQQPGPPIMGQVGQPAPHVSQISPAGSGDRPTGLPVPYHGQAQYSSQVHLGQDLNTSGLTPGSEPASQKSSRAPSPVPSQKYDALEGQFTPSTPSGGQFTPTTPSGGQQQPPTYPGVSPPGGNQPGAPAFSATPGGTMPPQPPSITSGKRVYPQMAPGPGPYMNTVSGGGGGGISTPPAPGTTLGGALPPQPGTQPPGIQYQPPGIAPGMHQPSVPGMPPPGTGPQTGGLPTMGGMGPPPSSGVTPPTSAGTPLGTGPGSRPNYPQPPGMGNSVPTSSSVGGSMVNNFAQMNLQPDPTRPLNLLQEKNLLGPEGLETVKPNLPSDYNKVTVNTDVFRCTLNAIPNTQSLLNKCRLPLGLLIHPFKDLSQLPVIQSSVIVRCRSCRTYINPFVSFTDARRWKCNLCYRVNELPEEFSYDPVSKTYGDPQRRPEIKSSTIEFIAPSEYMLRPPQPAVYLFLLDVSFNAVNTGYLPLFCQMLLDELDKIPGDSRTQVGFMTFDSCLQFYNLQEGLSQPQMLVVSDVEDVFLPLPEGLLVNIHESRELVNDLLNSLPAMFEGNVETGSALGPALQTAHKLLSATGGRVSVFQTQLPTVGPGALKNREDPSERTGKKVQHLGPAVDFYKKLALDCSAQQIAVDMFLLNGQYADLATIAGVSKYSGGSLYYFPNFHTKSNPGLTERFEGTLRRYFTRKIGFESVMRIRCSRGLTIHTFHGNFFVRSTDLLSLPNINPDSGFGMQMSIEDTIESNFGCFQAALLYTSSKGERRIRVHTLCIPVTNSITEVFGAADQQAIVGLIAKMAVDKSTSQSMGDARDALVNSCIDMLGAYGSTLTSSQRMGQLPCPHRLRFLPAFVLAMLKYAGFRTGIPTKLDDRVFALESAKNLPLAQFLLEVYPSLYPVHTLDDQRAINKGDTVIPQPSMLQLSSGNMDRHGVYLMDTCSNMYLWVGGAVSDSFCQEVLDVPNFQAIPEGLTDLPELDNLTSERLRTLVTYLNEQRPFPAAFLVIRDDSRSRGQFLQHMVEDRSDSTFSYYEFLQHLQKEVK